MKEMNSIIRVGMTDIDSEDFEELSHESLWEKFQKITGYEHEHLTDEEQQAEKTMRSCNSTEDCFPFFITDLKTKYQPQVIVDFLFKRFLVNAFVDSFRKRIPTDGCENTYDVHLWADEEDYVRMHMWEDIHPDIVFKNLASPPTSLTLKEYLIFLPSKYFLFVIRQLENESTLGDPFFEKHIDLLLQNYCKTL